ncbi:MAG TPA: hypothetical protein VF660_06320 [Actinomycetota bacterium]|jgi:hypothetical protein
MIAKIDFSKGLQDAWTRIATFVPKFIAFLLILLIGYFVAKILQRILNRILERVGFDRVVERGGVKKALERSKYDASDILSKIAFYIVFLFVLQLAFGVFGPNPISDLIRGIVAFLPRIFVGVVIVVITAAVATAVKEIVEAALGGLPYGRILAMLGSAAIWFVGISAALNQVEVAPEIVNGLFYAVLALVVGSAIVAIGGGGIQPMQQRWRKALSRLDQEMPKAKDEAEGATERIQQRAEEKKQELQQSDE